MTRSRGCPARAGMPPPGQEQQKRIGAAEFRNTHFSFTCALMGSSNSSRPLNSTMRTASAATRFLPVRCGRCLPAARMKIPACSALE